MDLPNLLNKLKSNSEEPKKFIAIEIGFDAIKTAIWQSTGLHTEVVSVGSIQSWSSSETDDLVTAIDTSLADAQTNVPEEPNQVIFGLPELWVDNDGIVETKKPVLKTICKRLDLKAIGFVVTTEAMVHHLRDVEGGPPSAILLQIATEEIAVSLVYLGKLETTQVVGRSTNIASDVEEGLARIPHSGHLPSRIILLTNLDDPEPIKQELISYDWQKKLEFLHFPKVESLAKDWSIRSIAVAGGAEVIESLGFANVPQSAAAPSGKLSDSKNRVVEPPAAAPPALEPEPVEAEKPADPPPPTENPLPDLGFKPISFNEPVTVPALTEEPEFAAASSGSESVPLPAALESIEAFPSELDNLESVSDTSPAARPKKPLMAAPKKLLLGFGRRVKALVVKPKEFKSSSPKNTKKILLPLAIFGGTLLLLAGAAFAYYRFPEASVDVAVGLNPYQQQLTFTIDPSSTDGNMENAVIAGKKIEVEKSGSKTAATTGTKMVGDRAKGTISIYNRTTAAKTFPAGTVVKTANVRFTLDSNVTVASASTKENSDFSLTTEPAKVDAAVTAADIGDQYNIAKDTQLSVANFSNDNFVAVVTAALSGGSARKVAAVSQDDLNNLKNTLIQDLQNQIDQAMAPNPDNGTRQISVGEPQVTQEKYSAVKGAEADEVTVDLTVTQTAYQYDVAQLSLITQQMAAKSLPQNVQLTPNSTTINTLQTTLTDDDKASVSAQVVLQYIPRIETDQYVKELVSVPVSQLESKLKTIPNFQSFSLKSKYLIFGRLPLTADRIVMHIKPVTRAE